MKIQPPRTIIVQSEVTPQTIDIAFEQWLNMRPRYETLRRYYYGAQDFNEDVHGGADQNRIVSNHCRYITDVLVGYQFGNEPRYNVAEGDMAGQAIIDLFKKQDKWETEINIGEDMSIYGKAFELVFLPQDKDEPASMELDPLHAFVAYAGDLERDSVFGAVVFHYTDDKRRLIFRLYVYDAMNVTVWEAPHMAPRPRIWKQIQAPKPHGFGRVPLIEYKNNRKALGDYEGVMELQDAYNATLSDRQDNQDSFAQAMLMLSGSIIGTTADEINEGKKKLKRMQVLQLDADTRAEYLVKQVDESGVQTALDAFSSDLHKLAMVPNLADEQFAGNASGIAMAYKLFGTDQLVSRKQSQMQMGFTRRCKLYDYMLNNPSMAPGYKPVADIEDMTITFNLNAPQDINYMATALSQLTASKIVSLQTARKVLSVIPDPEQEEELVDSESKRTEERTMMTYGYDPVDRMRQQDDDDTDE